MAAVAVNVPRSLRKFEENSAVKGFHDVSDHACTRNLKEFFGTAPDWKTDLKEIRPHYVDTYVRTLGPEKADRVNRILNSVPRTKKHRSFGLQYCDIIEKERLSSTYRDSYSDRHTKIKEPKRRSLDSAGPSGKERIRAMKEANDQRRLNKLASISRGVRWVKQQYENTQCSDFRENFVPIDLNQIERHKLPETTDSNVPLGVTKQERSKKMKSVKRDGLGTKPTLQSIEKSERELMSKFKYLTDSMPNVPQGPLSGSKIVDLGEGAKDALGCGFGSDKWRSTARVSWVQTEGMMVPRGAHRARGFCQNVDYMYDSQPNLVCLWNNDLFPTALTNPNRRTFP